MGIPSYFSHIVRRHRSIIKKYEKRKLKINNLYLDCNSLIYDGVRDIAEGKDIDFENILIENVCKKLIYYINLIGPSERVFIAFDGVAPVAKLNQQRNRRFKSHFQRSIMEELTGKVQTGWDTVAITPGTAFMENLGKRIQKRFSNPAEFGLKVLIVSSSEQPGEGEHKIYSYIRENSIYHQKTSTVIYGLDADLIMLTLNHLHIAREMYLFRETPHFIKSIDNTLDPNESYLMDIPEFGRMLSMDLNKGVNPTEQQKNNRISDYILLCFFLGNDFMPHFPALNIRTSGINRLMSGYKQIINKSSDRLTDGNNVVWKNIRKLVRYLGENEHQYLKEEYKVREKFDRVRMRETDPEKKCEESLMAVPIRDRAVEKYINPGELGWEERYYSALFGIKIDDSRRKEICTNYLEGLEWTINYYTYGCVDWRWTYKYDYPPLLSDLAKYVPFFDTRLVKSKPPDPVSQLVQLSYVLPRDSMNLLPEMLREKLINTHPEWYENDYEFRWAFCRYFWEAHAMMSEIHIPTLENMVK